jgi:hypothetical protein
MEDKHNISLDPKPNIEWDAVHSENIFFFKHRGSPFFCPYCNMNVNLKLEDYRKHLEINPFTCLHCEKVWAVDNDKWV